MSSPHTSTPPLMQNARCFGCNYLLRDLAVHRCPECGRPFDPSQPSTINNTGRQIASWAWTLLRPRRWPIYLAAVGVFCVQLPFARFPGPLPEPASTFFCDAWWSLFFCWLFLLVASRILVARFHPPADLRARRSFVWWFFPIILIGAVMFLHSQIPFRVALRLSRPALDRFAAEIRKPPYLLHYPKRYIGLFPARNIFAAPEECNFEIDTSLSYPFHYGLLYSKASHPIDYFDRFGRQETPLSDMGGHWRLYNQRTPSGWEFRWVSPTPPSDMRSDRRRLAFTLADDPKAAAQSVPALLELLKDTGWPQYMSKCIHGFRGTGDDVDVYASYVWSASSPDLVAYCPLRPDLIALVRAGPSIIPQLTPALADPVLRPHVLYVLGEIGPSAATAVPSIVPILADADPVIREQAACTLGLIGPAAQAAIPQLQAILGDPNPRVRYNALRAIHSIERSDRPLQVPDDPALKLIEEVGGVGKLPATAEELAAVIMPISDPYSEYHHSCHARAAACDALAALGQQAIPAIPALEFARWYDPSYIVRKTAARALQTLTIPTTHP